MVAYSVIVTITIRSPDTIFNPGSVPVAMIIKNKINTPPYNLTQIITTYHPVSNIISKSTQMPIINPNLTLSNSIPPGDYNIEVVIAPSSITTTFSENPIITMEANFYATDNTTLVANPSGNVVIDGSFFDADTISL